MTASVSSRPLLGRGAPAHEHNCSYCQFLGTVDRLASRQVPEDAIQVDLYVHYNVRHGVRYYDDVVARYGNEPGQVVEGRRQSPFTAVNEPEPHLAAARECATKLGYLYGES